LTTAEIATARGAAVVVAARRESDLTDVVARIRTQGGRATAVAADVARPAGVKLEVRSWKLEVRTLGQSHHLVVPIVSATFEGV
jgi:NADP-dependent 3-hydroxy acid dehydrogenase YdfG